MGESGAQPQVEVESGSGRLGIFRLKPDAVAVFFGSHHEGREPFHGPGPP